jgi:large subunit ribosomal protein L21
MYAVIKTGGKQYRVAPGEKLKVEKLNADVGQEVVFDQVLMTGGDNASVGTPLVDNASVQATVESHGRGNKIIVYKFKRRSGYHKKQGHRQDFTLVHIDKILAGGEEYGASKEASAQKAEDKGPETDLEDVSATDTESEEE